MPAVPIVASGLPLQFFQRGPALWVFLENSATFPVALYEAWKSLDGGSTWTQINGVGFGSLGWADTPVPSYYDGLHTVTFLYNQGNRTGNVFLQSFDLNSETWGAPFAAQGLPTHIAPWALWPLGGGFIALFQDDTASPLPFQTQIWDGSSWGALVDITVNAQALTGFNPANTFFLNAFSAIDPAGVLHVIFRTSSLNAAWNNRYFYQEVTPANTLQNFAEFPGQGGAHPDLHTSLSPTPGPTLIVLGNSLYWGIIRNNYGPGAATFPSVYIGTPLINPVWTELGNLDPAAVSTQVPVAFPSLFYDPVGGQIFADFIRPSVALGNQAQAIETADLFVTSQSVTLSDSSAGGPKLIADNPLLLFGAFVYLASGSAASHEPATAAAAFFIGPPTPPPPASPVPMPRGSSPIPKGGCHEKNGFDLCTEIEAAKMSRIHFPPMCTIPEEYRNLLPWDDTFGAIPPQAVPFHVTGSIVTPATVAGDQVVCALRVLQGFDGILTGIFQMYTGSGFVQGDGDIVWRIQINQRFVKDLSNNPFSMGTPVLPLPMTEGQLLLSGQTVRYIVNVPNLSGNIQVGASTIVCGLIGFYWPR